MGISLNGYIAKEDGSTPWSEEEWDSYSKFVKKVGNLIIGRRTYEIMNKNKDFEKIGDPFVVVCTSKIMENKGDVFFVKSPQEAINLLKKKDFKRLTFYTLICLSVAGIVYCFDIRVSNVGAISEYWQDHFISFASWESFFKTLGQNFDNLMSRWFAERPKWIRMCARAIIPIGFLQLLLGFWKTFKKDKFMFSSVNSIAFVVFMEHLILGALHKYPFVVVRTSLFFAPMLLLLTVQGFSWLGSRQKYAYNIIQYLFLVYLGYISIGIARLILGGDLGAQAVLWQ